MADEIIPFDKYKGKQEVEYRFNLRQSIFLTLVADTGPAKAIQRFVDVIAGPEASRHERVLIFEAWLKGGVKASDAAVLMLEMEASDALAMFRAFARADTKPADPYGRRH